MPTTPHPQLGGSGLARASGHETCPVRAAALPPRRAPARARLQVRAPEPGHRGCRCQRQATRVRFERSQLRARRLPPSVRPLGTELSAEVPRTLGETCPHIMINVQNAYFGGQPSTLITCQVLFHVPSAGSCVSLFRPLGGGHRPKAPRDRVAQRLLLPVGGSEAGIDPGLCVTRPETLLLWLR